MGQIASIQSPIATTNHRRHRTGFPGMAATSTPLMDFVESGVV
jgi:hypothetical protein